MNLLHHIPAPVTFRTPPLSAATRVGDLIFISGTPGYYADGHIDSEFVLQFDQAVAMLFQVLASAGGSLQTLAKVNVILTRASDVTAMNRRYAVLFGADPYPARTTVVVSALPDPRMLVEIEAIAVRDTALSSH